MILPKPVLRLSKLVSVLCIFTLGSSILSGLLSLLIFYVILVGQPEAARRAPVLFCVMVALVLSLPFYARAICGFISGESVLRALLIGSIKMGRLLYLKFLALSAVVYALSYFVRLLPYVSEMPALYLILTALIFIFLVPVMLIIYRRDRSFSPSESLERDEAQNTGLRLRAERGRAS